MKVLVDNTASKNVLNETTFNKISKKFGKRAELILLLMETINQIQKF